MTLPDKSTCTALAGLFHDAERFDVASQFELAGVPTSVIVEDTVTGKYMQVSWVETEYDGDEGDKD